MSKLFRLAVLCLSVSIGIITTSCLHDKDDERTEKTETIEISNVLLSLINAGEDVDTTASGIYYVINEEGTGSVPQPGDTVIIEYIGTFVDGSIFDSSFNHFTDGKWELVYPMEDAIAGFNESISLLKSGMEANFIIPSKLAYGEYWFDFIPPYTPLIFFLKLHELKPKIME